MNLVKDSLSESFPYICDPFRKKTRYFCMSKKKKLIKSSLNKKNCCWVWRIWRRSHFGYESKVEGKRRIISQDVLYCDCELLLATKTLHKVKRLFFIAKSHDENFLNSFWQFNLLNNAFFLFSQAMKLDLYVIYALLSFLIDSLKLIERIKWKGFCFLPVWLPQLF